MQSVLEQHVLPEMTALPEIPAPPTEPKKDPFRAVKWAAIGLGAVIVLGGTAGALAGSKSESAVADKPETVEQSRELAPDEGYDAPTGPPISNPIEEPIVEPEDDSALIAQAAAKSTGPSHAGQQAIMAGFRAIKAYDVDGAAMWLDRAADSYDDVGAIWQGVDGYVVMQMHSLADEQRAAADDLRAMRIGSATRHIQEGNRLLNDTTRYLKTVV